MPRKFNSCVGRTRLLQELTDEVYGKLKMTYLVKTKDSWCEECNENTVFEASFHKEQNMDDLVSILLLVLGGPAFIFAIVMLVGQYGWHEASSTTDMVYGFVGYYTSKFSDGVFPWDNIILLMIVLGGLNVLISPHLTTEEQTSPWKCTNCGRYGLSSSNSEKVTEGIDTPASEHTKSNPGGEAWVETQAKSTGVIQQVKHSSTANKWGLGVAFGLMVVLVIFGNPIVLAVLMGLIFGYPTGWIIGKMRQRH